MAKLGSVKLSITDESLGNSVEVTSYPVEEGVPFSDHVSQNPQTLSADGYILGKDSKTRLQKLRDSMRKGEVLPYVGRTVAKNVIITSIDDGRNAENANGSQVSIKLQFVRIVNSNWKAVPKKQATQQKDTTNSGKKQKEDKKKDTAVYHKVKKGETYSHIALKYKVSVSSLRKLNPWKDTQIPIGAKMRVK